MSKTELLQEYNRLQLRGEPDARTEAARQKKIVSIRTELRDKHGLATDAAFDSALSEAVDPKAKPEMVDDDMIPGDASRAAKLATKLAGAPAAAKTATAATAPAADNSGVVPPTPRKNRAAPDAAPPVDVAKLHAAAMKPVNDAVEEARQQKHETEMKAFGDKRFAEGDAARKEITRQEAEKKKQGKAPPTYFSAHDRAKYDLTQKLAAQGLGVKEIANRLDKTIIGAAKNAPGSLEGLPENFLDANNLTVDRPGQKTKEGFTSDADWAKLFPKQNPAPQVPAAPQRPGDQAFHDVLGPAWAPQAGEDPADARVRRASMIRDAVTSGTQYGTVGVGEGDILPNVPGVENPAGARGFKSPYGSGFATGMPLPAATPVPPASNNALVLPSAVPSTSVPGILPQEQMQDITYSPKKNFQI